MKITSMYLRLLFLLVLVCHFGFEQVWAQAPQKMSYQAVIVNAQGNPVANQNVGMRISILQGQINGTPVYVETHNRPTNPDGMVSLEVGAGSVVSGQFSSINWSTGPYFLKSETDISGGTNYSITGTSELLSVPYALYSNNGAPSGGLDGQVLTSCNGVPVWTYGGYCPGQISSIDCSNPFNYGILNGGSYSLGVTSILAYQGGNGGFLPDQVVNSTGVTGLTGFIQSGFLAYGPGSFTIYIDGVPSGPGTASFTFTISGQTCTLSRTVNAPVSGGGGGQLGCGVNPTAVAEVTNPATGKIWMDRNLGASQVASSATDVNSFGDLYQWGRGTDGHQCRNSITATTLSSSDQTQNGGAFILANSNPFDWRTPANTNLWQGVNGTNNPCPPSYRLPTEAELEAERLSWSNNQAAGAFSSPLKFPMSGHRYFNSGSIFYSGTYGVYWSSTISGSKSRSLHFDAGNALMNSDERAHGAAVRCIKGASSTQGTIGTLDCAGAVTQGTLTSGVAASGVSSIVSYTGGNAGSYNGQVVTSIGVAGLTATLSSGAFASGSGSLNFIITGTPTGTGIASFALNVGGVACNLDIPVNLPVGSISALTCSSAVNQGTLTSGVVASGVSSSVPYSGGNGGTHNGQTVSSSGVTGLTATLSSGTFANGSGSLIYAITGTPASSGQADFALNIGGQTCSLSIPVIAPVGVITALNCASAVNAGNLYLGVAATGATITVPYTGGNGGTHNGQTVNSTGISGLTATLTAGSFLNGSGNLVYNITGTAASTGMANFAFSIGGQTCNVSRSVTLPPASVSAINCGAATNLGTLTGGTAASGVSSSVPYTGGNGGSFSAQSVNSTGVTGLTATVAAGNLVNGNGSINYTISGTPSSGGTASFALSIGGQSCTLTRSVSFPPAAISSLNCAGAVFSGTLTSGTAASGVSLTLPYSGGNGGSYNGQSVSSTGITGLTATLSSGSLLVGGGNLVYTISGTPSGYGTATFPITFLGRSCSITRMVQPGGVQSCSGTPTVTFTYNGSQVTYGTVQGADNRCWLDRNLGASQVAVSSADAASYGDLFQWGRAADGHQLRNSAVSTTLSSSDQPSNGNYISISVTPFDWRSPQNNNLWQGVSGVNNPCPSGWRIPTSAELDAERAAWSQSNSQGAFSSPLRLPAAGTRSNTGGVSNAGAIGYYWSSTINTVNSQYLLNSSTQAYMASRSRSYGHSVRCIRN